MDRAEIIKKQTAPTNWVSPLVLVPRKDRSLRVCIDPRRSNEHIKRQHYRLPKREDIEAELAGAAYFSRSDLNSGFNQIPLDERTLKICTFATPFGRYRYLRLPFGISPAQEVFDGLPGVHIYLDDILVCGKTKAEHDDSLTAVLKAAEKAGWHVAGWTKV